MAVAEKQPVYAPWQQMPHSRLKHHGGTCCERAREWFLAMDYSLLNGSSPFTGPRWIRERYTWGPCEHPIHWCDAVKRKELDCGILGALSVEAFKARGVRSFPLQLVQHYSAEATTHWDSKWTGKEASTHWLKDDIIYHEGCAVLLTDGSLKLWDASAAMWMNPLLIEGYGGLAALRINMPSVEPGQTYRWGKHNIAMNQWVELER